MKTPLIERMGKREGTPKTWVAEVAKLLRTIEERDALIDEYGNIIDALATEREELWNVIGVAYHLRFVDDTNTHEEQMEFWTGVEKALEVKETE